MGVANAYLRSCVHPLDFQYITGYPEEARFCLSVSFFTFFSFHFIFLLFESQCSKKEKLVLFSRHHSPAPPSSHSPLPAGASIHGKHVGSLGR